MPVTLEEHFDLFEDLPFPFGGKFFQKNFDSMKRGAAYFNTYIPQILTVWNSQELVKRSTSQFLDSLEPGEPEKSFDSYLNHLGKLKFYQGIKKIENNNYVAEANFEKGLARIFVRLVENDNTWLIDNFQIDCLF